MPQSLSSVLIHLVFSTKNRQRFISPDIEVELHPYLATVLRNCGCPSLAINGTDDHVHILFALSRTIPICDLVEDVKKSSSKWIKTKGPAFRNFQWQTGYGAFSIGQSQVSRVREYIANQKQHHRRRSFQDEFRDILRKYHVEFDEQVRVGLAISPLQGYYFVGYSCSWGVAPGCRRVPRWGGRQGNSDCVSHRVGSAFPIAFR